MGATHQPTEHQFSEARSNAQTTLEDPPATPALPVLLPRSYCVYICMLADHCSQEIGIRLSEDGYITADWHMDSPPMRTVLLDPYTGYVLLLYVLCV